MNSLEKQLEKVKNMLFEQESVKTYFSLKMQIEQNEELKTLRENIKYHAQEMTKNINHDEVYLKNKKLYEENLKAYNTHPLVIDFNQVSEEVQNLLEQLKHILE